MTSFSLVTSSPAHRSRHNIPSSCPLPLSLLCSFFKLFSLDLLALPSHIQPGSPFSMAPRKKEAPSAGSPSSATRKSNLLGYPEAVLFKLLVESRHPAERFAAVVFISLGLSSALFTLTSRATLGELGSVSKHLEEWWEVAGLVAWKAVEVGLAWLLGFDGKSLETAAVLLLHSSRSRMLTKRSPRRHVVHVPHPPPDVRPPR